MILSFKEKKPDLDSDVFVALNASIIGDVVIGKRSSVWFGAVIRGDSNSIKIGAGTNIQDLCVLHVDTHNKLEIGNDVTVGHRAILHGCSIGSKVLIGMGATIMNGAVIGDESIVGAGALVTEGTIVPPRSLIFGMPAKVKRELSSEELAMISRSAAHYAEFAGEYKGS